MGTNSIDLKVDEILNKLPWNDKFNIATYALVFFAMIAFPIYAGNVFYATRLLKYRCFVPECESSQATAVYNTEWLKNAVPFHEGQPQKCSRYVPISGNGACNSGNFYTNRTMRCDQFVFADKYQTIAQDFGIYCDENNWKLTLPIAIGSIGALFSYTIHGFLSDRYGRRTVIIWAFECAAVIGTIKSFSVSYYMFIALEFIERISSCGSYLTIITYVCEQAKAEHRSILISITGIFFSVGEALATILSWSFYSWRQFVRMSFLPTAFAVVFLWISPESVRWLVSKKRYIDAQNSIKTNFHCGAKNRDDCNFIILAESKVNDGNNVDKALTAKGELRKFFLNRIATFRLLICSMCMFSIYVIYYGLTYYMISFHGNFFLNLMMLSLIEIPANLFSGPFLNCWSRRVVMITLHFVTGLCCLAAIIFLSTMYWMSLIFIVTAKFSVTIVFIVTELYVHEIFPTTIRGTLVSFCVTIGNIGEQVAIQVPLLVGLSASYSMCLPLTIFACVSICCCLMVSLLLESLGKPLPENVEEMTMNTYPNRNS